MKKLTCEMCGSTDLVKQEGIYVCQTCGAKYSVEEAKKMMIDGTVNVSGSTVKVDNSNSIVNYYKMAENAYESNNHKEAEDYCNKIIEIDSDNSKAWLLKGRAAGWQSDTDNIRLEEASKCFIKALDNATEEEKENVIKIAVDQIEKISEALLRQFFIERGEFLDDNDYTDLIISGIDSVYSSTSDLFEKCGVDSTKYKQALVSVINKRMSAEWNNRIWHEYELSIKGLGAHGDQEWRKFITKGIAATKILGHTMEKLTTKSPIDIQAYKNMISCNSAMVNSRSWVEGNGKLVKNLALPDNIKKEYINNIMAWHGKIKEIDPSYVIPEPPEIKSGGCYIATAVYGSYNCPQVWTLRRYRDYVLAKTWHGRLFIRGYYATSPTLVKYLGHTKWFKKLCKGKLNRMVANLKSVGIEDTPYEDRNW